MSTVVNESSSDALKSTPRNSGLSCDDKIQRLDRLANLGMLAAGMAHEIKNGMVAIKTFLDLLLEKNPDAELGEIVRHELQRINTIATQMLRIATPNPAGYETMRIHEIVDRSLRLLEPQINLKAITVKKDYCSAPDTVFGDGAQLQQVFMNLFLNALEAMGQNGKLTITTGISNDDNGTAALKIHVQDTGAGISAENLSQMFVPFFSTKSKGTGLGLAISQRILLEHGGTIEVQSEPGQGAVFNLVLPSRS